MDSLKLFFRSLEGRCLDNQFLLALCGLIHRATISVYIAALSPELIRWTQAASGTAGWANIGLCLASN